MKNKETDRREYFKKYYQDNKERLQAIDRKEYYREYYKNNKEKRQTKEFKEMKARNQKAYYKRHGNKDQKKAKDRFFEFIKTIKNHYGCLNPDCKWSGPLEPCCLDFHHLINEDKVHVSQMTNSSIELIRKEINKCTLLCATCHRLVTYDHLDSSQFKLCKISNDGNFME